MKNSQLQWLIALSALFGVLYMCWGILPPFIIALTISYLLMPITIFIESKWNVSRWVTALILVAIILVILLSIILVLVPLVYEQVLDFIKLTPKYKEFINTKVIPMVLQNVQDIDPDYMEQIKTALNKLLVMSFTNLVSFVEKIWSSKFLIVDIIWFVVLIPFITFYLIKDWNEMTVNIKSTVPEKKQIMLTQLSADIQTMLSGFVRGQLSVCLIFAIYYTLALSFLSLNYSIFIGLTTGILLFIPFVGWLTGFICAMIVAYLQFNSMIMILPIAGVYLVGVVLDSGIIGPRLIGNRIGLHPVWIIFFVLLGAKLLGFVGMLLAIPLGATVSILIKFVLKYYYKSKIYSGNKAV